MAEAAHPGRAALAHSARVLAGRPHKDDDELTYATQCLAAFRKELIAAQARDDADDADVERLSHLNAIISVVMAMHFPIGGPPWDEFEKAQAWLQTLVDDCEG